MQFGTIWKIGEQEERNRKDWNILTNELDRKGYIAYNVSNRDNLDNLLGYIAFMA